jgi:hypothetical protein
MNKRSRTPRVRKGQPAAKLSLTEFSERFHARITGVRRRRQSGSLDDAWQRGRGSEGTEMKGWVYPLHQRGPARAPPKRGGAQRGMLINLARCAAAEGHARAMRE